MSTAAGPAPDSKPRHRIVERMDEEGFYSSDGYQYDPPHVDAAGELLTLALLEDLSKLLVVHGYPPLRGRALAEIATAIYQLRSSGR